MNNRNAATIHKGKVQVQMLKGSNQALKQVQASHSFEGAKVSL
jgi:hypothetical protein